MSLSGLIVLLIVLVAVVTSQTSYDGYKIFDLKPISDNDRTTLKAIARSGLYDFWGLDRVLVKPERLHSFEEALTKFGIQYSVFSDDVNQLIRNQHARNNRVTRSSSEGHLSFRKFHNYETITGYLNDLTVRFPNLVSVSTYGTSYEGRPLKAARISTGGNGTKPVVLVDAGIHAREWMAPTTALYTLYELTENFENNKDLLDELDWVIVPVVNPDGYEYSLTEEPFWRKTRRPIEGTSCIGVDGNRNFGFHWSEGEEDLNPCSDTFPGKEPFSEPETRALGDLLLKTNVKLYLTLHSFGGYILHPWGYKEGVPKNWRILNYMGGKASATIRKLSGVQYIVGGSAEMLYIAAGGSDDFAVGEAGVPFAFTYELPKGGKSGFDPDPDDILPTCKATVEGFKVMARLTIEHLEDQ